MSGSVSKRREAATKSAAAAGLPPYQAVDATATAAARFRRQMEGLSGAGGLSGFGGQPSPSLFRLVVFGGGFHLTH